MENYRTIKVKSGWQAQRRVPKTKQMIKLLLIITILLTFQMGYLLHVVNNISQKITSKYSPSIEILNGRTRELKNRIDIVNKKLEGNKICL